MTTNAVTSRMHGLDTLRAIAVVAVMMYHLTIYGELPERILTVTYYGFMGVDLFFVLSGFLIGQQLLKPYASGKPLSIGEFYLRRAFRILPAYWAVVALYFLVPAWREFPRLAPLWKYLTFTSNLGFSFSTRGFSHAWSLCVEEHFYLVLPLLVALLMRKPSARKTVAVIVSIAVFGVALRYYLIGKYPDDVWPKIYYPSYTRLDGLLTGVTLAVIKVFRPARWNAMMERGHALLLAGVVCVGGMVWMSRHQDLGNDTGLAKWAIVVGFPLLSLGLGLITASGMSRNGLLARFRVPGAKTVATLAFALYLTHKAVGHFVMLHFQSVTKPQGPASWLLYAVACFAVASLLHVAVERPFLRLRDRVARRKSDAQLEVEMRQEPAL